MSLNEQCGLPVRTFGGAAVAQAVNVSAPSPSTQKTVLSAQFPASGFQSAAVRPKSFSSPGLVYLNELFGARKIGKVLLHLFNGVLERGLLRCFSLI